MGSPVKPSQMRLSNWTPGEPPACQTISLVPLLAALLKLFREPQADVRKGCYMRCNSILTITGTLTRERERPLNTTYLLPLPNRAEKREWQHKLQVCVSELVLVVWSEQVSLTKRAYEDVDTWCFKHKASERGKKEKQQQKNKSKDGLYTWHYRKVPYATEAVQKVTISGLEPGHFPWHFFPLC